MGNLAERLGSTSLNDLPDLEQLLFKPQAGSGFPQTALDDIPRYLFRVASPLSAGETNEKWVVSEAAYCGESSSKKDIFDGLDNEKRTTIARTLNLHFRWWPKRELEDNFVSWTSSLLDAIQFIYYRHLSPRDKSELDDINLFIIDTTLFPKGTFLRDLDLIDTFCDYDTHEPTKNLEDVRYMRDDNYFGEYLSQGELKIEGKCEIISAKSLFQCDRLCRVQPRFLEFHELPTRNGKPVWAIEVIRLREAIWTYADAPVSSEDMIDRLDAVKEIIQDLKPGWRFPLAIYFTALIGAESTMEDKGTGIDNVFLRHFNPVFSDDDLPFHFNVVAPESMPEMTQVEQLLREIYKFYLLGQALDRVISAGDSIHSLYRDNVIATNGRAFVVADRNELLNRTGQSVLAKLRRVQTRCELVISAISSNED